MNAFDYELTEGNARRLRTKVIKALVLRTKQYLANLALSVHRYRLSRRAYRELHMLSNRELKDLGFSRTDITAVANGKFFE